jgi:hypothetical protein
MQDPTVLNASLFQMDILYIVFILNVGSNIKFLFKKR